MRIARVTFPGDTASYGVVDGPPGAETVAEIDGEPFGEPARTGRETPLSEIDLLAPVLPSKIVVIGRNYADHATESPPPDTTRGGPPVFLKPATAVVGPAGEVVLPSRSENVVFEGELAVVIGRTCRMVPPSESSAVVWGYTCANDVTARDLGKQTSSWTQAKSFDTFSPLGPWVATGLDASDLRITVTVNGVVRQKDSTASMVRSVDDLVGYVSAIMTLLPGDVILTGTPAGNGAMHGGDTVSVEIQGIGTLNHSVTAA